MKKGISLVSLTVVIIVMVILAGIVVVTGLGSVESANINQFALEILNIQTAVDEYHYRYNKYPVKENITVNTSDINSNSLNQFSSETIADNQIVLKTLDLSLIGMNELEFGNNNEDNDVYALSEITGKIYYLAGIEYEGVVYYTLTDDLYKLSDVTTNMKVNATDIKKYDVIFTVSNSSYTNESITVDVKIPEAATYDSVTATDSKSVSEPTTANGYNVIQINQTSENRNGNYIVEVNYTYNEVQRTVTYEVKTFDNTVPTVQIYQEYSAVTNEITVNASDAESGIKQIKYELSDIENAEYFKYYGKILNGNKIVISNYNKCTVYVQDNAGNYSIVKIDGVPDEWSTNVTAITDTVPIPKGFVASSATGENTKNGGLVIYEGDQPVTDANVEEAKRTRNQYVWVPVDKNTFDTTFVRKDFDMGYTLSNTLGTENSYWEVNSTTQLTTENLQYMTEATLTEVQSIYASVKKYGGFYIARYETGIDNQRMDIGTAGTELPGIKEVTKVYSMMNKIPYNYIPWTWNDSLKEDTNGAVEISRNMYTKDNTNYGVVSTLTYGVQWDRTLQWFVDTGAITMTKINSTEGSTAFGNYNDHVINNEEELNDGAKVAVYNSANMNIESFIDKDSNTLTYPKQSGTIWALSTGALKAANINNIYDMAGNMHEWTMEGNSSYFYIVRGGCFYTNNGTIYTIASRYSHNSNHANYHNGFRSSLYIKM